MIQGPADCESVVNRNRACGWAGLIASWPVFIGCCPAGRGTFTTILRIRTNVFNSLRPPWVGTGFSSAIPECGKSGLGKSERMASIWSPVIGFELSAAHAIELGSNCKTDQPPQIGFELLVGPYPHSSSVAGTVPMVSGFEL